MQTISWIKLKSELCPQVSILFFTIFLCAYPFQLLVVLEWPEVKDSFTHTKLLSIYPGSAKGNKNVKKKKKKKNQIGATFMK